MNQPSLDLELDDPADPTYSVREVTDAINQVLRRGFRDGIWVRGEVEGFKATGAGHYYFSLSEIDEDGRRCTMSITLFGGVADRLRPLLARNSLRLRNGLTVRIHGQLDVYAPTGKLSLVMDAIDPAFTLGRLAADRDQLLRRLADEQLIGRNAKLPVSVPPLNIGVVTSVGSAAWHDFRHELERSGLAFHLRCVDVRVQGESAARWVAAAIGTLSARADDLDVIALIRGGGSKSDLATFDGEAVAYAIARSAVPVWTGLGHEIDRSVADEVAHRAFKTPTACAAALVELVTAHIADVEELWMQIGRAAELHIGVGDDRVRAFAQRVASRTTAALELADQRLVHAGVRVRREAGHDLDVERGRLEVAAGVLRGTSGRHVTAARRRVDLADGRLVTVAPRSCDAADRRCREIEARVRLLDPARILARGWSITRWASDGRIVRSRAELQPGDLVDTTVVDGTVRSRVEDP